MRVMYRYWLDLENPREHELANICEQLKGKREFAKTIRDGIRLITSLKRGDLSVLLELFPGIAHQLQPAKDDTAEKLNTVITLLQSQQSIPMLANAISHQHTTQPSSTWLDFKSSRDLSTTSPSTNPDFGMDGLSLDITTNTSEPGNSAQNLIDSLLALC